MSEKQTGVLARLALVTCTLIWGSSFFIMKNTLDSVGSFCLLAIRFTMASLLLAAVFCRKFRKMNAGYITGGAVLGLLIGAAYAFQTVGLSYTTPGKNAFFTAVYCLIVPFLYWAVAKKRPDRYNIVAAALCLAGVGLASAAPEGGSVNVGDLLTLFSGFLYACHIVAVNRIAPNKDVILLTIWQFIFSSVLMWAAALAVGDFPGKLGGGAVSSLLYLGIVSTAVALMLQNVGQKYAPPSTAALIMSLESVFGVAFSVIFTHERLTPRLLLGFALIFSALVVSEAKPGKKPKSA